ncbi:hypothetical protein Clacol_007928 [Clathrus columnatus]|uniref:Uncharacterized protein n=1 Tax=Clathrus columnatus TaxID=1419009 RepID=A0AAV5AIT7_9AGAM|nr:hypothetical protein Clacol_007928 [Clathrus columnatus]
MSSSSVLPNQAPSTDEDLIYRQLFKEFIDYPSDDDTVVPISQTVRKKHENESWVNDKAKSLQTTSSSSDHDSESEGNCQAGLDVDSAEYILAQWEDFVQWMAKRQSVDANTDDQQKENTGGVGKGKALATHTELDIQCSRDYEQDKENIFSQHNPNVGMTHAQHPVNQQSLYVPSRQNNIFVGERPCPINTSTIPQNKENEHNPNVGMPHVQRPVNQQSLCPPISLNNVPVENGSFPNNSINNNSTIPQSKANKYPNVGIIHAHPPVKQQLPYTPQNNFVRGDSLPINTINNNSIIPAQTQTVENVPPSRQSVCDNGSEQHNNRPRNEIRRPNFSNVNGTYYQSEFIQGSSKGNLNPSFIQHPDYTNEGKIFQASQMSEDLSLRANPMTPPTILQVPSIPSNSFNYRPSTWSKRPREDDVIAQPSPRPHKRHNGDQTQPSLPLPSRSTPPLQGIISTQLAHAQPSVPSFSGINTSLSFMEHRIAPEVFEATRKVEGEDECGGGDEDAEGEDDDDAEGEECGEDEYEYV